MPDKKKPKKTRLPGGTWVTTTLWSFCVAAVLAAGVLTLGALEDRDYWSQPDERGRVTEVKPGAGSIAYGRVGRCDAVWFVVRIDMGDEVEVRDCEGTHDVGDELTVRRSKDEPAVAQVGTSGFATYLLVGAGVTFLGGPLVLAMHAVREIRFQRRRARKQKSKAARKSAGY